MIRFLNTGSGGGSSKANIFIQDTEPEIKEGIWFKKTAGTYDKLITADTISSEPYFELGPTQLYMHNETAPVAVGTDIYLFGGSNSDYKCEKINTINNIATALPDINESGYTSWNTVYVPSRGIIRLEAGTMYKNFGLSSQAVVSSGSRSASFTGQYDRKQNLPLLDNDLYFINQNSNINIYNFSTENITTKTGISVGAYFLPYIIQKQNSNYIYCFNTSYGGQTNNDSNYKYDILTNTYQKIAPLPDGKMALQNIAYLNDKIHIFGIRLFSTSADVDVTQHYIYNTDTDTWDIGIPITTKITQTSKAVTIGDTIYITNAGANNLTILKYREPMINFEPNSVVLQNGNTYKTALLTQPDNTQGRVTTSFNNAYMTDNSGNLITTDEKYYGNGTEWIAIN